MFSYVHSRCTNLWFILFIASMIGYSVTLIALLVVRKNVTMWLWIFFIISMIIHAISCILYCIEVYNLRKEIENYPDEYTTINKQDEI